MFFSKGRRILIQYPLGLILGLLMAQMPLSVKAQNPAAPACCNQPTTVTQQKVDLPLASDPTSEPATISNKRKKAPAPQVRPDFTSRSLMAVGRVKSIDSATSTVVVEIDREKSNMPHILLVQARQAGLEEKIIEREFPAERAFKLSKRTLFLDARPDPNKTPVRADTGKIATDPFLIKFGDFTQGEWVSVLYRMRQDPTQPPIVFNVSKVDPEKNSFSVDFNPLGGKRQFTRPIAPSKTGTQADQAQPGKATDETTSAP